MNRKCLKLIGACLLFFANSGYATDWDTVEALSIEKESRDAHFALSFGRTDIKGDVYHHQGSLVKLQGGYRFSDYVVLEIAFVSYGKTEDQAGLAEQEILGASFETQLLFIVPVLSWMEPYAKLGVSSWIFDVDEPAGLDSGTDTFEGEDAIYGAGFLFNVDHDSTLRLEYEMSSFKDAEFDVDVKQIVFGIHHRF